MVSFVAGLVSAITVPGDYLLFHNFPFYDLMSLVLTMGHLSSGGHPLHERRRCSARLF